MCVINLNYNVTLEKKMFDIYIELLRLVSYHNIDSDKIIKYV